MSETARESGERTIERPAEPYLPVGSILGEEHAEELLRRYRPAVLDAGRALAARLAAEHPGRRIEGRAFLADDIVGHARGPNDRALVMALAWYEDDHGRFRPVALALDWETGRVVTVE